MSRIALHWDRDELGDNVAWLESPKRLSESVLWKIQEAFYQESGIAAWDVVPMFITNNPLIAQHYAKLILAFVQDNLAQLDTSQPINILELAGGAGRFSFFLVQELNRLKSYFPELANLHLRVVLTDFSEKLLDYWLSNPKLKPYFEDGSLDVATYNPFTDKQIKLAYSGETLQSSTMANPCMVVANYFFDTIPHDLFIISPDETIQELLVSPFVAKEHSQSPQLDQIELLLEGHDISFPYYTDHPEWDDLLKFYSDHFRPGSDIIMPTTSLSVLDAINTLSPRGLVFITTDRGLLADTYVPIRSKQFTDITVNLPPVFSLSLHGGAFSLDVNFHALKAITEAKGGVSLNTDQFNSFVHTAFMWFPGTTQETWVLNSCRYHFYESLTRYNAINSFVKMAIHYELKDNRNRLIDFRGLMALFQISNYDPYLIMRYLDDLDGFGELQFFEERELERHLDRMVVNQYTVEQTDQCGLNLGELYRKISRPQKAIDALNQSVSLFGSNPAVMNTLALCYSDLGNYEAAIEHTQKALSTMEPNDDNNALIATLTDRITMWRALLTNAQPSV